MTEQMSQRMSGRSQGQTTAGWVGCSEDFGFSAEGGGMRRRDVTGPLWLLGKNRLWGVRMKERGPVRRPLQPCEQEVLGAWARRGSGHVLKKNGDSIDAHSPLRLGEVHLLHRRENGVSERFSHLPSAMQ